MTPQTWMVPRQKYDVDPLHPRDVPQAAQPGPVRRGRSEHTSTGCPRGRARGPAPAEIEPWVAMDYGPSLMATDRGRQRPLELRLQGDRRPARPGAGGSVSRDGPGSSTTTTRCAWPPPGPARASSTGTASTSTASTRSIRGSSARSTSPTPTAPAGPTRRSRAPTTVASSAATAGATARCRADWAHYRGLYHHGDRVILAYTVGKADDPRDAGPRDRPRAARIVPIFTRTLEIGPSTVELTMRVGPPTNAVGLAGDRPGRACRGATGRSCCASRRSESSRVVKVLMSERRRPDARGVRASHRPPPNRPAVLHPRRPAALARGPQDAGRRSAATTGRSPSTS